MMAMNYISLKQYAQNPEVDRFRHGDTLVEVKPNIISIDFSDGDEVHIHFQQTDALVRVTQSGSQKRSVLPVIQIPTFLTNLGFEKRISDVLENIPYVNEKILVN